MTRVVRPSWSGPEDDACLAWSVPDDDAIRGSEDDAFLGLMYAVFLRDGGGYVFVGLRLRVTCLIDWSLEW